MKTNILLLAGLLNFAFLFGQSIDKAASSINFSVGHVGFGAVKGAFQNFDGTIHLDENNLNNSKFNFSILSNSVTTRSKRRSKFIKSEEFFDADVFPKIKFKGIETVQNNNGYSIIGFLTIKGISKQVEIPFDVIGQGNQTRLSTTLTIDRFDYGIGMNYKSWVIDNEVRISIDCVLEKTTNNLMHHAA